MLIFLRFVLFFIICDVIGGHGFKLVCKIWERIINFFFLIRFFFFLFVFLVVKIFIRFRIILSIIILLILRIIIFIFIKILISIVVIVILILVIRFLVYFTNYDIINYRFGPCLVCFVCLRTATY